MGELTRESARDHLNELVPARGVEPLPPCTRCGHSPDDHRISSEAEVQDPTDERARFRCVGHQWGDRWIDTNCECPNYEQWTRP